MICIANNQCAIHALGLTDAALNPSSSRFLAGGKILQDYIRALALSLAEGGQLLSGPEVQFTRTFTKAKAQYTQLYLHFPDGCCMLHILLNHFFMVVLEIS
jgi:hypothetical protein